ncbi:uncharacterized protein LOC110725381 [Chenopodium quinoa]|uniref:Uncharacterized protein n=1 Tax=Chenopodium quinoa TaxID=63459 RepID=A0A803L239_CHEQI|nr:uncharacterized protein LOC110725381 [Chenopodium quinoa]
MEGTSVKLSILVVVLVVFASFFSPYTAEARRKHIKHRRNCHPPVRPSPETPSPAPASEPTDGVPPYQIHGCGYQCSDSNDCDWPCTVCCANQTCCYDEPYIISDPFPTLAPSPSVGESVPAPALAPTDGVEIPPYEIHGCGYKCSDSNDCDWPCTTCCANQTCCNDESFIPTLPSPAPAPVILIPLPSVEEPAAAPSDGFDVPPNQIHGCGHTCSDSNDCDWPCTICCANQTCCNDESFIPTLPSPAPAPQTLTPLPIVEAPASAPSDSFEVPPYQIHACGYRCSDSNDCDWPCTTCCANQTCCNDESFYMPPFTSSDPLPFPPFSPSQPPSLPPSTGDEADNDLLAPTTSYYDVEVPASLPPQEYEFLHHQVYGCGYGPCRDSIDCAWPCTTCCADHTCCQEDLF